AVLLAALVGMASATACSAGAVPAKETAKPAPAVPAGGVLLQGAGATFPALIYDEWFRKYQSSHPLNVVTYDAVGSGEGIRRFIGRTAPPEEKVASAASDAAMRDDEMAQVPEGAVLVPMTAGSIGLAYNLPDVAELRLSREAYAGIFMGQITTWNDRR